MKLWLTVSCFFVSAIFVSATVHVQENTKETDSEICDLIDDFALLEDASARQATLKNEAKAPPFTWPVDIKNIKHILMLRRNTAQINVISKCDVFNTHKGIVVSINEEKGMITIRHIVPGGVSYITILENLETLHLKKNDIIMAGVKIGQANKFVKLTLLQDNVQTEPSIDLLFAPLKPGMVKVVSKI